MWTPHPNTFQVRERRMVPTISLHTALALIGQPISFLKIDAQGLDARILASANSSRGNRVSQLRRFSIEMRQDSCYPLYRGQPTCSSVMRMIETMGAGHAPVAPIRCERIE